MGSLVMIAAGGTGGHLFPAQALASVLQVRGVRVILVTDERIGALAETFPAERIVSLPSATPSRRSPLKVIRAVIKLSRGFFAARRLIRETKPDIVIGFGGYPTVPPVLAAALMGAPTIVHEQNGVIGRANRFLARYVTKLATSVPELQGAPDKARAKIALTGNPVRAEVLEAAAIPYAPPAPGGELRLLVFGGSQGARVMSDVVPQALGLLSPDDLARIRLVQQARGEDETRVREACAGLPVEAEVAPFFADLPARIARAHLVVSRSGASTVSELAVIGRPSILVPLPGALDQDQAANAQSLARIDAALLLPQSEFTPERLAKELKARLDDPERLTKAAAAAKSAGIPDAAEKLADLVVACAQTRP
ncbi:MAG: undecaprenyldiphospho-muramoylpentapeptide beta-N-acetylglucosaminyltransferase [Salinarimonadaceae bacterium]|nr:MAG: undecaprenyldiphospho-muramoylpentapeptide beta-N-acetylglucosaminyltransferase [Salinarimonadaceae bacterium]